MGQEITATRFKHNDFQRFDQLIEREAALLADWFREGRFSDRRAVAGLELETWLVDAAGGPVPLNTEVIDLVNSDDVVPELSKFNVEFNVLPQSLEGAGLATLEHDLDRVWKRCDAEAARLDASVVAIGTLPTLRDEHLSLGNISPLKRFQALNEQTLRLREGRPIRLDIEGRERLQTEHRDVMLEAATTSFQLHLQTPLEAAVRYYNAAIIVSAPLVAVSANSPLLLGRILWDETRIPLFEQAVDVGGGKTFSRVTFGSGYVDRSLEECFIENREHYPVMLPLAMDDVSEQIAHLRLHNGTIWRWIRPLVGFDDDGTPHLRIEQRVMPAGPTTVDMAANMAFYYGLLESFATADVAPETQLPFATARDNFYRAARFGFDGQLTWFVDRQTTVRELILWDLLPLAREGLTRLRVDAAIAHRLLEIIEARVTAGQNGAVWQRRFIEKRGRDLSELTCAYRDRQRGGMPIHTWDV